MDGTLIFRSWRIWIALLILVGVFGCSAVIIFGTALSDLQRQPTQEALAAVSPLRELCGGGSGSASAKGYTDGAGPHRLIVFRSILSDAQDLTAYYNRTEDYPAEWRATGLGEAELVACVHAEPVVIEECSYTLDNGVAAVLQRVQWLARIVVHDARSGDMLDEGAVEGSLPRACQDQESFTGSTLVVQVAGEQPAPTAIAGWLEPWVMP